MSTGTRLAMSGEWKKSSYSGNGNNCVEVAGLADPTFGAVGVRDSKDPGGPALVFSVDGWADFVRAVKRREFVA